MALYILTGEIQSGKTSAILKSIIHRDDVGGFLTPDHNGKRMMFDAASKALIEFEVDKNYEPIVSVGRFCFNESAFESGSTLISHSIQNKPWTIWDEGGILEEKKSGFISYLEPDFIKKQKGSRNKLLIVVRNSLLKSFMDINEIDSEAKIIYYSKYSKIDLDLL